MVKFGETTENTQITLSADIARDLREYLLARETDIASGFEDFSYLYEVFKFIIGREPVRH